MELTQRERILVKALQRILKSEKLEQKKSGWVFTTKTGGWIELPATLSTALSQAKIAMDSAIKEDKQARQEAKERARAEEEALHAWRDPIPE